MAWTCLILIVCVWIRRSSHLLVGCLETKEKEWLGVWGSPVSHSWVPLNLEMNCIILLQNSLLSLTHPKPHFPSSWRNNQTCHGRKKGQNITFSFKQHCLDPVVFSVFIYCPWSWNTFQMWFARAPARSQPSRGALAGLRWPQGVLGWGAPLPVPGLGWGLSLWVNPGFSFAERGFSVALGERNVGVCRRLCRHRVRFLMCVLEGRGWTKGACPRDSTRREVCALGRG